MEEIQMKKRREYWICAKIKINRKSNETHKVSSLY